MIKNTEWKRVYASLGVTVVCAAICIAAFSLMDGFEGGFAVAFVTFFLAICGIAVAGLFFTRAREMDAIIENKQVLAHWVYREEDALQSADREFREYQYRNHAMFILIGGMLAVVALFFLIFVGEGGHGKLQRFFLAFSSCCSLSQKLHRCSNGDVHKKHRVKRTSRRMASFMKERSIPTGRFSCAKPASGSSRQKKANLM